PTGPDLNTTTFGGTNLPPTGVNLLGNLANSGLNAGDAVIVGNPLLAPLDYYGRPTKTMPLLPGSPAIDGALLRDDTPAFDQRGDSRPSGPRPDIGAVEAFAFSMIPLIDTDNDGIDDRLEPAYGLVVGVDNRATDSDGDGSPDGQELFNMTDPTNPSDNFRILSFVPVPESLPAPLAQWVADDWTGGTAHWVDRIGGKIATVATAANSPTKTSGLFPQRGASASSGLVFDGVDDYFSVSATENPLVGKTSVTIAAYFLSTQGASGSLSSHWQYPGPLNGASPDYAHDWGLTYNAAGEAQGFFDYPITPSPAVSVIDGQPHSMILTWQDQTVFPGEGLGRLYVDGVLVGQTPVPTGGGDGIVNDGFVIGSEPEQLLRYFSGAIGELRCYDSIQDPPAVHAQLMEAFKSFDVTLRTFPGLGYSLESSSTLPAGFQDIPGSAFFATGPAHTLRVLLPTPKAFLRAKRLTGD
ncbi:MAG: LamG domain-containing protein, partial [Akkermansiaceae bacterium]|nr:LamG domain-containing protein [Akkermansiaceae bacterium]